MRGTPVRYDAATLLLLQVTTRCVAYCRMILSVREVIVVGYSTSTV